MTQFTNDLHVNGITKSISAMSLENRLIILPNGVVSKNDMGFLRIFSRRCLCNSNEAATPTIAIAIDATAVKNPAEYIIII